jgi:hypothetical protein
MRRARPPHDDHELCGASPIPIYGTADAATHRKALNAIRALQLDDGQALALEAWLDGLIVEERASEPYTLELAAPRAPACLAPAPGPRSTPGPTRVDRPRR